MDENNILMQKCLRFHRCSAPLCPLDKDVSERVYLEGEPICKAKPKTLQEILGEELEGRYKEFIRVSLQKGAKFTPWTKVKNEANS